MLSCRRRHNKNKARVGAGILECWALAEPSTTRGALPQAPSGSTGCPPDRPPPRFPWDHGAGRRAPVRLLGASDRAGRTGHLEQLFANAVLTPPCTKQGDPGHLLQGSHRASGTREGQTVGPPPPGRAATVRLRKWARGWEPTPVPSSLGGLRQPPLSLPSGGTCGPSRPGRSLCKRGGWSSGIRAALSPGHLLDLSRASQPGTRRWGGGGSPLPGKELPTSSRY